MICCSSLRTVTWAALSGSVALCVAANGLLSVKAGMFPMPDPRHASWQFLLPAIIAAPFLLLLALWRQGAVLRAYLLLNSIALGVMIPLMMHRVAPVFEEGTMQRLFAMAVFTPIGVAGYILVRAKHSRSG
jgi:hypothetical protein